MAKYATNFVNVKINTSEESNIKYADKYKISAIPVTLFLDSSGKVLNRVEGFVQPPEYLSAMKTALAKGKKPVKSTK